MPDVLVRDVESSVLKKLKERASRNGRSLQSEVRVIISDSVVGEPLTDAQVARRIKAALVGRNHSDSVKLLRRDRMR